MGEKPYEFEWVTSHTLLEYLKKFQNLIHTKRVGNKAQMPIILENKIVTALNKLSISGSSQQVQEMNKTQIF